MITESYFLTLPETMILNSPFASGAEFLVFKLKSFVLQVIFSVQFALMKTDKAYPLEFASTVNQIISPHMLGQ